MRQTECFGPFNLPEHVVGAVTLATSRFIKGVNRGQAIVQLVDDGDHFQVTALTSFAFFPKFDHVRVHMAVHQKLNVLGLVILIHAATRVPGFLIPLVERVVLL